MIKHDPSPSQQARLDMLVDQGVGNEYQARARVFEDTAARKRRFSGRPLSFPKSGHVRDYESDLDHRDEMEALPAEYIEEENLDPQLAIPGIDRELIKASLRANEKARIIEEHGKGTVMARAALRAYEEKHPA